MLLFGLVDASSSAAYVFPLQLGLLSLLAALSGGAFWLMHKIKDQVLLPFL
jgi:hypothetical protein